MTRHQWLLSLFAATVLAQLAVPSSMIIGRERVLKHGKVFKFKTAPVDPYDAIRGRYVALNFDVGTVRDPRGDELRYGQTFYVTIASAPDGFVRLIDSSRVRPDQGVDYLKVRATYPMAGATVTPQLPFDRFYMSERLAPAAQQAYRAHNWRSNGDSYVTVRVADGVGVIENLFIGGRPIGDVVRAE